MKKGQTILSHEGEEEILDEIDLSELNDLDISDLPGVREELKEIEKQKIRDEKQRLKDEKIKEPKKETEKQKKLRERKEKEEKLKEEELSLLKSSSTFIGELERIQRKENFINQNKIIYIASTNMFFWENRNKFYKGSEFGEILGMYGINSKEYKTKNVRIVEDIYYGEEKWDYNRYNLLNIDDIIFNSEYYLNCEPEFNELIDYPIKNMSNGDEEMYYHLYSWGLFRGNKLDSYDMPCLVFKGTRGGIGKGLFIRILSRMLGMNNVLENVTQSQLESNFTVNDGRKLLIEFAEIASNGTDKNKETGQKLKNIIGQKMVSVNKKYEKELQLENRAAFIITSNKNKPIHLDGPEVGNRRFTIFNSDALMIPQELGKKIEQEIDNHEKLCRHIKWAMENEKIPKYEKFMPVLETEAKKELEYASLDPIGLFWNIYLQDKQKGQRIKSVDIKKEFDIFCKDNGYNSYEYIKHLYKEVGNPKPMGYTDPVTGLRKTIVGIEITKNNYSNTDNNNNNNNNNNN